MSPKKILVAEDDYLLMQVYESKLSAEGYQLIKAMDGEEASMKVKMEKPDLVLLDLIMPGKNGYEVLEEMKSNDYLKSIPVIILSNLGQDTDVERGMEIGASEYLIKSNISIDEIMEKIRKYCG